LETSKTAAGRKPTTSVAQSAGGVSLVQSSWLRYEGLFPQSGYAGAVVGAQIQIADSLSQTCRSNSACHVR
jgi:hypothetical protein